MNTMTYKINKGLDLKLDGAAPDTPLDFVLPDTFHIRPSDFRWLKPKLLVQAGDHVEIGSPLSWMIFHARFRFLALSSRVIFILWILHPTIGAIYTFV